MHAEAIQHLFSDSFIRTIPSVPELHRFSLCGRKASLQLSAPARMSLRSFCMD